MASRTFNSISPCLQSISLQWQLQSISNQGIEFRVLHVLPNLLLLLRGFSRIVYQTKKIQEYIRIGVKRLHMDVLNIDVKDGGIDMHNTAEGFVKEWLPRVSRDLKSPSPDFWVQSSWCWLEVLSLIFEYFKFDIC